jgi:hypothetical protein
MGQRIVKDGLILEVQPDGSGVVVGYADAPAQGRIFTLPPNPKDVRQEQRAEEDQQLQREAADRAERAAIRADKTAQRQAAAAERAAAAQTKPSEFQSKSAGFLGRMMQAEHDFALVPETDKGGRSIGRKALHDILPGVENTFVNSPNRQKADQAIENFIAASLRQESGAAISPMEFERQYKIFFPAAGDSPEVIAQKAAARRQAIEDFKLAAGPLADDAAGSIQKADNEVPDPTTGADLKPPPNDGSPPDSPPENGPIKTAAQGQTHTTYDARTSAQIDAMINAGASKGLVDAVLARQKLPIVSGAEWKAIQDWRNDPRNRGKKYYGANISRTEDLNLGQRLAGSAPAAGLAHMADATTAGTLGAVTGEQGRGALDAMAALHPDASVTGDVAGGVMGALGAEAAVGARAPAALARFAPRIADALYGGGLGFNTAKEGEGVQGAALGAGAGLAGGMIGQRLFGGYGRAVRGIQDANVGYLRGQGIPLTVGQTVGGSGRLGATVKNIEDALTSVPGVSSVVNARRTEGLEAFNQAALRQAGAPAGIDVNATGAQGMEQLRQGIGPAYDQALGGVQINTQDPGFLQELQQVVNAANAIPPVNGAREAAATALDARLMGATDPQTGIISGRGFQEAYRGLGRTARERANGDYGHEVGQVMRQGQNVLADALDAQNPGALEAFRNANSVNRNANVIAQALDKAKNQGDELFTPAQINTADAMSARRLNGPMASAAGDRPFFDLARAGQEVLPSKLPDSGTATRGLIGASLVGGIGGAGVGSAFGDAGTGAQTGLGLTLLLAAGGSRPAQAAMVNLLTRRPAAARRIGDIITRNAGIGGWTGAGTLTPLLVGN